MLLTIRARQSKVIFPSENYQVLVFKTVEGYEKSSFTACGNLPKLTKQEEIILTGEFKNNGRFGEQFHVDSWKRAIPNTKEQLVTFFSSSLFKGVGKKMAEKIVHSLGKNAIRRISKEGSACLLLGVDGMKEEMAKTIAETVNKTFVLNELIEKFATFGISSDILLKAHLLLGQKVTDLYDNPYLLSQYHLIHFATADHIGMKMGILPQSILRLETVIKLGLKEFIIKQGHCYLEEAVFIEKCLSILNADVKNEQNKVFVQNFIHAMELTKSTYLKNGFVYPTHLYFAERDVARSIHQMTVSDSDYKHPEVEKAIFSFEKEQELILTSQQKNTIHQLLKNNVLILTGGPGTGKTFTVNGVLNVYKKLFPNTQVALAAPTGRAAKKLGEVTGMGSYALTIHRLLGIGYSNHDKPLFDEAIPLPFDLLIADEFSMADIELSAHLLRALKRGTKLLIVGDPDQLPSPGAGNVLKDLLDAGVPHVCLDQIFRQAEESTIIKNAHRINKGECIDFANQADQYFLESKCPKRTAQLVVASVERFLAKGFSLDDMLVLSPMKKGDAGIESLNDLIRKKVNPSSPNKKEITYLSHIYREGDKVMYIRNNKELDAYNGDIGTIKKINSKENIIEVEIDKKRIVFEKEEWKYLKLAYAITIHKAQGGEAKVVITVLSDEHDLMLTRNLFYTAITRTKTLFALVGSKNAANKAVKTNRVRERKTSLTFQLSELRKYINHHQQLSIK